MKKLTIPIFAFIIEEFNKKCIGGFVFTIGGKYVQTLEQADELYEKYQKIKRENTTESIMIRLGLGEFYTNIDSKKPLNIAKAIEELLYKQGFDYDITIRKIPHNVKII